jgi:hypothetical protein
MELAGDSGNVGETRKATPFQRAKSGFMAVFIPEGTNKPLTNKESPNRTKRCDDNRTAANTEKQVKRSA